MITRQEIVSLFEQYDVITIFRHTHPDCDAVGSQFGLKQWLKENYPWKQVYALGTEQCSQGIFPPNDEAPEELISQSLAVVLDSATAERTDDQRFLQAAYILRIDHHPVSDDFGNVMYIYTEAAATCELLTEIFAEQSEKQFSSVTAGYLYKGLLTDTLCFRTSNTTGKTLSAAAVLANKGIDIPGINRELFDQSLSSFQFASFVRSRLDIPYPGFGSVLITLEDQKNWNIDSSEAKTYIDEIGHISDLQAWVLFVERLQEQTIVYDGSLRSKSIPINGVASVYRGGGHKNAAGVKGLSKNEYLRILKDIIQEMSSIETN